ncbi:hypothetical protein ACWDZ8_39650 [Streptomyces sp. NPDC003233]
MSFALDGPVLEGALVRLEPLTHRHATDLAASAEEDRSAHGFTWVPRADEVEGYIGLQQLLGGCSMCTASADHSSRIAARRRSASGSFHTAT